jgi:anthranilate phosphoribosyltransferase
VIKEAIAKVVEKVDLTEGEAEEVMDEIMSGAATPAQIGSFITALRMKGETIGEITGSVRSMRKKATPIRTKHQTVVDTCGTGGDGAHTFNISTTAALVVAGAGVAVAKHGNRSVSSKCGSADLLKELGVNVEVPPEVVERCLDEVGIGFLFAPMLHGAMKHAIGPRREIGVRTVFNILGPLTNPAGAQFQMVGVFAPHLTETVAEVLKNLGSKRAFVVHGADGLDEITIAGSTKVSELNDGRVRTYYIDPKNFGIKRGSLSDISGGDPSRNAQITKDVLAGKEGPARDVVILNAAVALVAGGASPTIPEGIAKAARSIDSGAAKKKLDLLIERSNG